MKPTRAGTNKLLGLPVPLEAVVSPYHLTTREAPAMVASLVCDSAVTFLPSPRGVDLDSFADAVAHAPRYRALLDSWAWCSPLWDAAVITKIRDGFEPGDDVVRACERLMADDVLKPLRGLAQRELFDSVEAYLDLVSRDILRAGSNPGISVPVSHGLDEFAFEQGLVAIRPEPTSLVQRVESKFAHHVGSVSLPIVQQGDGRCVMEARHALSESLDELRDTIEDAMQYAAANTEESEFDMTDLKMAAQTYAAGFAEIEEELARVPMHDEPRFVAGHVTLTLATLPRGVAFTSALAAGQRLVHAGAPAHFELDDAEGRFATIFVKTLGGRSGARR